MTIPARIRCFFLEPIGVVRLSLRRLALRAGDCPRLGKDRCHVAMAPIGETPARFQEGSDYLLASHEIPDEDPRWPASCACGYAFAAADHRCVDQDRVYRRADTGELMTLEDAPDGAMWFAPWYADVWRGADGKCLVVRIPVRHDWIVDGRASNCTLKNDDVHKCWVRHGTPPRITADKKGVTCKAGGGSILTPEYHGHLVNGELVKC